MVSVALVFAVAPVFVGIAAASHEDEDVADDIVVHSACYPS